MRWHFWWFKAPTWVLVSPIWNAWPLHSNCRILMLPLVFKYVAQEGRGRGRGNHLHSCVVILKQGPADPTLNTDICNVELWPLITDIHSKLLPRLHWPTKDTHPFYTPLTHIITQNLPWTPIFYPFFAQLFSDPYCGPHSCAACVKPYPFPCFLYFFAQGWQHF